MESIQDVIKRHFNVKIIAEKTCPNCGEKIKVTEMKRVTGEVVRSDKCLSCENKRIRDQAQETYENMYLNKTLDLLDTYSSIPPNIHGKTFDEYKPENDSQQEALKKARWYAENFMNEKFKAKSFNSLVLYGNYGVGKSHLAYCIYETVRANGHKALFINLPDLLKTIRSTYDKNSEIKEKELLDVINKADLLVCDEIGAEHIKRDKYDESWALDQIYNIVNGRSGKPTIYTTNSLPDELVKKYHPHGGRIVSRMFYKATRIKVFGDDYRLRKKEEW